jgi:hypothetical protein
MFFLMMLTLWRYSEIKDFELESKKHSLVVEGEFVNISAMKADLQNLTHQPVDEELVTDGQYNWTFRCPPEKIGFVFSLFDKFGLKGRVDAQEDQ